MPGETGGISLIKWNMGYVPTFHQVLSDTSIANGIVSGKIDAMTVERVSMGRG